MFLIVVVLVCLNVCRHWLNVVDLAVGDAKKLGVFPVYHLGYQR